MTALIQEVALKKSQIYRFHHTDLQTGSLLSSWRRFFCNYALHVVSRGPRLGHEHSCFEATGAVGRKEVT